MAGEDQKYTDWVRRQPCAACLGPGPCEPHHSTNGSTQSKSPKALGGRRGKGQRAHDHEAIPLHMRCHRQFHDLSGMFSDWDKAFIRSWQDAQVEEHRARYEKACEFDPSLGPIKAEKKQASPRKGDPVAAANAERKAIAGWLKRRASESRLLPDVAAEPNDLAELLEGRALPMAEGIR